jgi:hypothetical protein
MLFYMGATTKGERKGTKKRYSKHENGKFLGEVKLLCDKNISVPKSIQHGNMVQGVY